MSRTDTAIRVISAPPDRVFAALTDPDALASGFEMTGDAQDPGWRSEMIHGTGASGSPDGRTAGSAMIPPAG
jgi:uncharacterized protein YndB with AHSA1/START domain